MCVEVTFKCHGSQFLVSLAWSFPSPCFGPLCLHVAAAMGTIRWGTRPPTFSDSGNIIHHVPHIFLFRFRNLLVSHQVVHPTFCNKIALMAAAPAWLLHHFPSSSLDFKSLDCPLSSLRTILPIDIKSPARSEDVRVMHDLSSCHSSCCFFTLRTLSIPAPHDLTHLDVFFGSFGGVPYRAPLKRVSPGYVRTPLEWAWTQKHRWH